MTQSLPSYTQILSTLDNLDADIEPSELHGVMCGLLCANSDSVFENLINSLLKSIDSNNLLHKESLRTLTTLFQDSAAQLNDPTCDFHLLLPDEETTPLEEMVFALGEWCQGFLMGLTLGGISELEKLPEESGEIANDFMELAQAGSTYEVQETEEDEESFQELLEYVRVGVLLINENLNANKSAIVDRSKLH